MEDEKIKIDIERRRFFKQCLIGGCGAVLGGYTFWDLLVQGGHSGLRVGFHNSAPDKLWQWSKEALWYEKSAVADETDIYCKLCPHQCVLGDNDRGLCRTRVVKDGKLYTIAYGNPCALHLDPVEKKPLNHFLPGSLTFSLATAGCNLRCLNCQNWDISQSRPEDTDNADLPPEKLVQATLASSAPSISYTYSEPVIYYEYVYDSAQRAREKGLKNILVTAGYILPQPLKQLCAVTDAAHVDVKSFSDKFYKRVCGASLKPILETLRIMKEQGVWVEIIRLMVTTLSDQIDDVEAMCKWIVENLGPDVPLHLSRFHPSYKLSMLSPTPLETLRQAEQAAKAHGLRYVYVGNVPEEPRQDTACPNCRRTVISRIGYRVISNILEQGRCVCGNPIPGVWA